jgi:hypothetical protein
MKLSPTEKIVTSVDRPLYPDDNRIIVDFNVYDFKADEVTHAGGYLCLRQSDEEQEFDLVIFNPNGDVILQTRIPYENLIKELDNSIRMRDDLAEEGLAIPASKTFSNYDHLDDVIFIGSEELEGATYGDDPADADDHPFCYVQLKDGRSLYFMGVDLDFGVRA